jgi:hypothetical protein
MLALAPYWWPGRRSSVSTSPSPDLVIVNVASTGDSVLLGVRRRLTRRRRFTTLGFALVIDQPLSKGASHEQDRDDERGNAGRECHGRRE